MVWKRASDVHHPVRFCGAMDYLLIALAAAAAAGLTFFSGFGLGTLLLPVLALFFSVELAVALTAVAHFLSNLLKLALLGRHADRRTLMAFGVLAMVGAYAGAQVLLWLAGQQPLVSYRLGPLLCQVTAVKLTVAILLIGFTLADALPVRSTRVIGQGPLMAGGLLSGFFGGLSGHQGALRSAFLIRSGLTKEQFLGTSVVLACLVDLARLSVYASGFFWERLLDRPDILVTAVGGALLGTLLGNRLLPKVTLGTIRLLVTVLVGALALGLGLGVL